MSHEDDRTIALMAATLLSGAAARDWYPGSYGYLEVVRGAVKTARALVAEVARTAEREKETDASC